MKQKEIRAFFDNLSIFSSLDLGFERKKNFLAFLIIVFPCIRIRGSAYFWRSGSRSRKPKCRVSRLDGSVPAIFFSLKSAFSSSWRSVSPFLSRRRKNLPRYSRKWWNSQLSTTPSKTKNQSRPRLVIRIRRLHQSGQLKPPMSQPVDLVLLLRPDRQI